MAGITYILPISISIVVLLGIVYFSYRQTIEAYPQGGGSYTVASENLGVWASLKFLHTVQCSLMQGSSYPAFQL